MGKSFSRADAVASHTTRPNWKVRAEKAEAELLEVKGVRDGYQEAHRLTKALLATQQETTARLEGIVDHYEATERRLVARIAKFEEKLKLAKSLLWRETDEGPITILDVE
jgi:hypothetical protein